MRRRRPTEVEHRNPLPEKLRRFRADEWPGMREYAKWDAYSEALDRWQAEHPDVDADAWTEPVPDIEWNPDRDGY